MVIAMRAIRSLVVGLVSMAMVGGLLTPAVAYLDPPWDDAISPWLMDVEVVAPDDVWAVGMQEQPAGKRWPLILHRDATGWAEMPFPRDGWDADAWLVAVDAVAPDDVWAVGNSLPDWDEWSYWDPLVLHWDGVSWSRIDMPGFRHFVEIRDVEAVDPARVFVAGRLYGDPLLLRWNGAEWSERSFPRGDQLEAMDARSRGLTWAVGERGNYARAYRRGSGPWRPIDMPRPPDYTWTTGGWVLHDVVIQRPDRVWFVGAQRVGKPIPQNGLNERIHLLVERRNGDGVRVVPMPSVPGPFEEARSVATFDDVVWVVGYRTQLGWGDWCALVLVRGGRGWWAPDLPPGVGGGPSALMAVDGVGRRDVWAVGLTGEEPLILRGAGGSWVREESGGA